MKCRLLGHDWRPHDWATGLGLVIDDRCAKCRKGRRVRYLGTTELQSLGLYRQPNPPQREGDLNSLALGAAGVRHQEQICLWPCEGHAICDLVATVERIIREAKTDGGIR